MLPIPPPARTQIEELLGRRVTRARAVGGGCINENFALDTEPATTEPATAGAGGTEAGAGAGGTEAGAPVFLKWNPSAPEGFFEAEARGLGLLREAAMHGGATAGPDPEPAPPIRVPAVLGSGDGDSGAWLLLEYIEPGQSDGHYWRRLGTGLADLHLTGSGPTEPNFLGTLPQSVQPGESWANFWIEDRLMPRLDQARAQGRMGLTDDRAWDRLLGALPRALPRLGPEGLGLLHGDLWSGNVFPDEGGYPVLVDPAVYLGDGRVDLAMAELFGGFSTTFFQTYQRRRPVGQTYESVLRDAYQLYPLLAHVNLFGSSYMGGTMERVHRLLATLEG